MKEDIFFNEDSVGMLTNSMISKINVTGFNRMFEGNYRNTDFKKFVFSIELKIRKSKEDGVTSSELRYNRWEGSSSLSLALAGLISIGKIYRMKEKSKEYIVKRNIKYFCNSKGKMKGKTINTYSDKVHCYFKYYSVDYKKQGIEFSLPLWWNKI